MLFFARGHRLTSDNWFYQGRPVPLADDDGVLSRLKDINATRPIRRAEGNMMTMPDVLYGKVKRAISARGGREYVECSLRARHQRDTIEIAFGNAIVGVSKGNNAGGFAMFRCADVSFEGRCISHLGNASIEGSFDGGAFSWTRIEPSSTKEKPVGEVNLRGDSTIRLELGFPSRIDEQGWGASKVSVKHGSTLIGHVIKSLNPIFTRGYRPELWFQDEVPVFHSNQRTALTGGPWQAVLAAIFGTWFCYRPVRILP